MCPNHLYRERHKLINHIHAQRVGYLVKHNLLNTGISVRTVFQAPIFLWDLACPQGRFMDDQIFKNLPPSKFEF